MRSKFVNLIALLGLFLFVGQSAWSFSLLGPKADWQTPALGYDRPGFLFGPMNIGEEYRWNTKIITYGFEPSFLNYFGSNGVAAVEEAISILNALPNASDINPDDYPLQTRFVNYQAASLNLVDLKSIALNLLLEEMGTGDPNTWVYTLRDKDVRGNPPITNYTVLQRNFDPITFEPTPYINSVLYTYDTILFDTPSGDYPHIVAVDSTDYDQFLPQASYAGINFGHYSTGLSRDDVGAIRYMLRAANRNVEELLPDVLVLRTNTANPTALWTLDLAELIKNSQDTTNTAAQLLALTNYNNLHITSTTSRVATVITTNRFAYYINYPWAPEQVIEERYTTNVVTLYTYEFGNIVVLTDFSDRPVFVRISDVVPSLQHTPGLPDIQTNIVEEYFDTEFIRNGEFYILPTNTTRFEFSGPALATNVTVSTNVDFFAETLLTTRTNTSQLELLITTDLATFSEFARTNDAAALLALYPDLLILSSNRYFTNIVSSNYVTYLTNSAWDPAIIFSIGHQWIYTTNVATNYNYVFGNVVTNFGNGASVATNTTVLVEETIVAPNTWDPAGSPFMTNVTSTLVLTNTPMGNIYVVPTNLFGYQIVSTQWVEVVAVTNTFIYTNVGPGAIEQSNTVSYIRYETNYWLNAFPIEFLTTNDLATNIFGIRREVFTYATNRLFEIYAVELSPPTNSAALRPGVEKLTFVRLDQDSLLGPNAVPITNSYIDTTIVSNMLVQTEVWRVYGLTNARPDIVFGANDTHPNIAVRTPPDNWDNNADLNTISGTGGRYGPGVIRPPIGIAFNTLYPIRTSSSFRNNFANADSFVQGFGSFDGTTNAPIVYPSNRSIEDLEQEVLNPLTP